MIASENMNEQIKKADQLRIENRLDEAEQAYREIILKDPDAAWAHYRLGCLLEQLVQPEEAEKAYRESLRVNKNALEVNNTLAIFLARQQRWQEAEWHYRVALAEEPDYYDANLNLGILLQEIHRNIEARYYFNRAVALRPDRAAPYQRLGDAFRNEDRTSEAVAALNKAVELEPNHASAWASLASCYLRLTQIDKALECYRRAAEISPTFLSAFKSAALTVNYKTFAKHEAFSIHQEINKTVERLCEGKGLPPGFLQSLELGRRLKIGFVSGDFRFHSVSYFLFDVLKRLNHHAFEFHAYFTSPTEDSRTAEFKVLFHHWHKVSTLSFHDLARKVREHRIDILIDLSGNTSNGRTEAFALRPAPIQMTWIGYPNTSGISAMDYRLVDAWTDPEGVDDEFYTESRLRLPGCFLSYTPLQTAPPVATLPALERGYITFGSFNQRTKLSARCIRLWSRVLAAVPESRVVLKSISGYSEEVFRDTVFEQFEEYGIERARVTLLTSDINAVAHLERYAEIDIALDTIPYNGTTTTCEALWMGVPVVTCVGDRHASRVGLSLLNNANLAELIGKDDDEFVRIATDLASDLEYLAQMRAQMRERLSGSRLLDSGAMALALETLWRDLWHRYCETAPLPVLDETLSSKEEPLRLHIGGEERRDGWTILDIDEREEVDVVCSILGLNRYDDESVTEVYCSHVLQCLPIADVIGVLQEMHRILIPGGVLFLAVPDLDALSALFTIPEISGERKFELMRLMFGRQKTEHDFYRVGLTYDFLDNCAGDVGFSELSHVESFGLFDDSSELRFGDNLVSLNLIIKK